MTSRRSSGSMRADSAVEPTKSENITVIWRRSARSAGETLGAVDVVAASAEGTLPPLSARTAATERQPRGGLCASASPIMLHRMGPFLACAVKRRRFPVGANPTRQPLQPEATGAAME